MTTAKAHNEPAESRHPIQSEQQNFREPLVVDPGLAEAGKRIRIGMEEVVILEDQLSGAKVPPDVGIADTASGHGEQAKREDSDENPASLQETGHVQRDCMPADARFPLR